MKQKRLRGLGDDDSLTEKVRIEKTSMESFIRALQNGGHSLVASNSAKPPEETES